MRRAFVAGLIATAGIVTVVALAPAGSTAPAKWQTLRPSPLARTEVGAARIDRYVYVVGGFEEQSGRALSAVLRYDLGRDRWTRVRSLPTRVHHAAVTAWDGRLYVTGGYTAPRDLSSPTRALYVYNPLRDRWKRLRDAPTARGAHTVQALGGRLYAVGGVDSAGATGRMEIYDVARDRWSPGPAMPTAREHLASAVVRGRLHVLAGRTGPGGNLTTQEAYNPRTRRWSALAPMRKARGGIAAAAVDGDRLVVLGGEEGGGTIREVEMYDARSGRWSALTDMKTPRHGLGATAYRGRVYAIEGGPSPGFAFSSAVEALQIP